MRISGSGIAWSGRKAIKNRRELWLASDAISCLHDALLAVAKGDITPDKVRDFFWHDGFDGAEYIGGVLSFEEHEAPATGKDRAHSPAHPKLPRRNRHERP